MLVYLGMTSSKASLNVLKILTVFQKGVVTYLCTFCDTHFKMKNRFLPQCDQIWRNLATLATN